MLQARVLVCAPCFLLTGCGSSSSQVSTATGSTTRATAKGSARFAVIWPARNPTNSRLIPFAANSIQVSVTSQDGKLSYATGLIARPTGGGNASATFDRIPVGLALVTATAFPNADGTGEAQATATVPVTIVENTIVPVSLTMASTITSVAVTPTTGSLGVGATTTFAATPEDVNGNVVLTSSSTLLWSSSAPAVATVSATGVVTGVSTGTATITVTETESGKSGTATVTVSAASKPTPSPSPGPAASLSFALSAVYNCPNTPGTVRNGDLDHDSNQDVVVTSGQSIVVFFGKGDGTLAPYVTVFSGADSPAVAGVADLNNDGLPDIYCSSSSNNFYVLINQGNRTFKAIAIDIGSHSETGVAADLNGDGYLDLATVDEHPGTYGGNIKVITNHGGTSFSLTATLPSDGYPIGLNAADFNHDGKQDLVLAVTKANYDTSGVEVFLGNGDATFGSGVTYTTGNDFVPESYFADFNGDGNLDIAVNNSSDNNMGVLMGNGDGSFQKVVLYPDAPNPGGFKVADMDGDGHADIVTPNDDSGKDSIFRNDGDGTFAARVQFDTGQTTTNGLCLPDLNNDGRPDIVNCGPNSISVLINTSK